MDPNMKRITFRADAEVLEAARERAKTEGTTLNELARHWLADYARPTPSAQQIHATFEKFRGLVDTSGQKFTRDEMNERR